MYRIGSVSLIVGSIAFFIFALLRPIPTGDIVDNGAKALQEVVDSGDLWVFWEIAVMFSFLPILIGLWALYRSMADQSGSAWSQLAFVASVVGTAAFVVLVGFDGFGIKWVADAWASAPPEEKATALRMAQALEAANLGLFGLVVAIFFGIATLLYGLAIWQSGIYSKWLG